MSSSEIAPHRESAIEQHSIDYVPSSERHGKVWHQGPFWFTGNFVLPTMVAGFVGASMGLSVGYSVLAILLGVGFGTFFMAFHANQGPRMGLPQMIQSRAQFGSRGSTVPFAATVFVYVGFLVFDTVLAEQGIGLVLPDGKLFWYPLLIAVSIVIAVVGHDLLHFVQRWLTYLLIVVFAILTIVAIVHFASNPIAVDAPAATAGWDSKAFLVQFSLAAGYNISYSVYVSDYTRYLPANAPARKLITAVYSGATFSAVWLMSLGAILATYLPNPDPILALREVGDLLFPGFGLIVVITSVLALISIMGVNAYGAMLTGTSAIDGFRKVRPTVRLRVMGLVMVGAGSLVVALLIPDDYIGSFNNFVLLMLYFLVPWTAVNLVDFYFVRRGTYAIAEILKPDGIYGRWAWRGVTAYIVGFIAMIPFFSTSFYVGPVAEALGGADFSFVIGLIVSGVFYRLFSRNLDRDAEAEAHAKSEAELEGAAR
ncbi:cytosine permease [Streptomyces sp. NBC_01221]|uniref:purine-cytosine permease family protein n=1 Tax=unclassified Streptomyces TaxID=2593676 RepID=UPI00225B6A92|nr:cytosine permease [Streptomyces sp. NBC_01221]MCX4789017.1 cytosine permease [Streptomyces sp. NBC_01221]WSP57205.1 cytosine permease [Streptomyces sp. NBC_01241]WSU22077.1 cytosine permease [Streptomyces sp. NBC_01108]